MAFKKALKEFRQLRIIIAAPSGGGKTFTALRMAKGIISALPNNKKGNGRIALIDTENHSSANYAKKFDFDLADIKPPFEIPDFIQNIRDAKDAGYPVLIIDSGSHVWKQILNIVDKVTAASSSKNSYTSWKTGDKILDTFLGELLYYPGHVIMCLRSKMEYVMEKNDAGKTNISKVGLSPQMRNGIEYEFDFMLDGTIDHFFTVGKTRYEPFDGMIIEKPGEEFGAKLVSYILDNDIVADEEIPEPAPESVTKKKFTPKPPIEKIQKEKPQTDNKKYLKNEKPQIDLSAVLAYDANTIDPEFKPTCDRIFKGWNLLGYNDFAMKASVKKHLNANSLNVVNDQEKLTAYYYYLLKKFNETKGE